jgi:hypothetical protein
MTHPHETVSSTPRKRSPLPWVLLAVFIVALGVVLVPRLIGGDSEAPAPVAESQADPLLTAVDKCDQGKQQFLKLADKNTKLSVSGAGKKFPVGLSEDGLNCVFSTLGIPGALSDRMTTTVAADGQLEGDWPGFSVTWTNDPDKGLDFTVTQTD